MAVDHGPYLRFGGAKIKNKRNKNCLIPATVGKQNKNKKGRRCIAS